MNKKQLEALSRCAMFADVEAAEAERFTKCAGAWTRHCEKGEEIIAQGEVPQNMGIVISGMARAERRGRSGLLGGVKQLPPSSLFGEALAFSAAGSPVRVVSLGTDVLFIPHTAVSGSCQKSCATHAAVVRNLLAILSDKYWEQAARLDCICAGGIRSRVAALLGRAGSGEKYIELSLSREGMADYLAVDRSALSRELAAMKNEGLIDYDRNRFRIIDRAALEGLL